MYTLGIYSYLSTTANMDTNATQTEMCAQNFSPIHGQRINMTTPERTGPDLLGVKRAAAGRSDL
jgi:hypothetical protein